APGARAGGPPWARRSGARWGDWPPVRGVSDWPWAPILPPPWEPDEAPPWGRGGALPWGSAWLGSDSAGWGARRCARDSGSATARGSRWSRGGRVARRWKAAGRGGRRVSRPVATRVGLAVPEGAAGRGGGPLLAGRSRHRAAPGRGGESGPRSGRARESGWKE